MNRRRIRALADFIEKLPDAKTCNSRKRVRATPTKKWFDMRNWIDTLYNWKAAVDDDKDPVLCGTAGCIAGWAYEKWGPKDGLTLDEGYIVAGKEILGIDDFTAHDLFVPGGNSNYGSRIRAKITPKIAAKTLRKLAETGEVTWPTR